MLVKRVLLRGWTTSFRYPRLIAGSQPSLKAPPPSTVYGLVSAAVGRPITPEETQIGYVFRYLASYLDLEAIQKVSRKENGSFEKTFTPDIVLREVLFDWSLFLYCQPQIASAFEDPYFALLLGRSSDLASVVSSESVSITHETEAIVGGTMFPLDDGVLPSELVSLPLWSTTNMPRERKDVQVFQVVSGRATALDQTVDDPMAFDNWRWTNSSEKAHVNCWMDDESGYGFHLYGV